MSHQQRFDLVTNFRNGLFHEFRIRVVGAQHRLDFAADNSVAAVIRQPARSLAWRTRAGFLEECGDPRPLLGVHVRAMSPSR